MDQKLTAMNKLVHDSLSLYDKGTEETSIGLTQSDIGDIDQSHIEKQRRPQSHLGKQRRPRLVPPCVTEENSIGPF